MYVKNFSKFLKTNLQPKPIVEKLSNILKLKILQVASSDLHKMCMAYGRFAWELFWPYFENKMVSMSHF